MFKLKINPDDGQPFEVESTSRDIVRWECSGKGRSIGKLTEDLKLTDITDLAWFAADRRGLTELDIRQWRSGVDIDFTKIEEDDPEPLTCPHCGGAVPVDGTEDGTEGEDEGEDSGPTRSGP